MTLATHAPATQTLRDLIEDLRYGAAGPEDLHRELNRLEAEHGIPYTVAG